MDLFSYLLGKKSSGGGGSGGLDWSAIGYSEPPLDYQKYVNGYNYAKTIYDNWTPQENLLNKYKGDTNLIIMPLVDTSIANTMSGMFWNCTNLISVPLLDSSNNKSTYAMFYQCKNLVDLPVLDTSNVTEFTYMIGECTSLSDESLDNVLKMCINATSYTGTKTLEMLSPNHTAYPREKIRALPSYQDFIDAGWTIGY